MLKYIMLTVGIIFIIGVLFFGNYAGTEIIDECHSAERNYKCK